MVTFFRFDPSGQTGPFSRARGRGISGMAVARAGRSSSSQPRRQVERA